MTAPLERLLGIVASVFAEAGVDYMLIGGCARNAYAPPRATRDVDVSAALDAEGFDRLSGALADRGFEVHQTVTATEGDPTPDVALFRAPDGARVDVLVVKTAFEAEALGRSVERVEVRGGSLPLVTPEDLLVYKLIAGRPRDLADAEEVVRARRAGGHDIDWKHVAGWCSEWEVTERLDDLRTAIDVE